MATNTAMATCARRPVPAPDCVVTRPRDALPRCALLRTGGVPWSWFRRSCSTGPSVLLAVAVGLGVVLVRVLVLSRVVGLAGLGHRVGVAVRIGVLAAVVLRVVLLVALLLLLVA